MPDTHRRIHNKGPYQHDEGKAAEAITPGMLANIDSSGNIIKHALGEVQCVVQLAAENALQGDEVTDAYATNDRVMLIIPGKGTLVNCLVESGQNIVIADYLGSGGDGHFIEVEAATSGSLNAGVLVQATESSSGVLASATLISCRVL